MNGADTNQEKQRLFFALWPDAATRRALGRVAGKIPKAQGRAVSLDNLHITLSFIGEVDRKTRDCLQQAAAGAAVQPFTLTLDRLGYFARTRVLWLGASSAPPELAALSNALNRRLRRCGRKPERRRFVPHVTLVRKARPLRVLPEFAPVHWPIGGYRLMRSVFTPERVEYYSLKAYPDGP